VELVYGSRSFFYIRVDRLKGILDCNAHFVSYFPGCNRWDAIVHEEDLHLIPDPEECVKNPFAPADVEVRVNVSGQWMRSVWHIASNDSLIFTAVGSLYNKRTLADDELLNEIRAKQSHQIRKPIASLLGLVMLLDSYSDADDIRRISERMKSCIQEYDEIIADINNTASTGLLPDNPAK
jgi:signal transduction histidine kinase